MFLLQFPFCKIGLVLPCTHIFFMATKESIYKYNILYLLTLRVNLSQYCPKKKKLGTFSFVHKIARKQSPKGPLKEWATQVLPTVPQVKQKKRHQQSHTPNQIISYIYSVRYIFTSGEWFQSFGRHGNWKM